ncbi:unnamed protein product [Jaminaea pallidilutea]
MMALLVYSVDHLHKRVSATSAMVSDKTVQTLEHWKKREVWIFRASLLIITSHCSSSHSVNQVCARGAGSLVRVYVLCA